MTSLTPDTRFVDQRSWTTQNTTSDDQTSSPDQSFDSMLSTLQGDASASSSEGAAKASATTAAGASHPTGTPTTGTITLGPWSAAALAAGVRLGQAAGSASALAQPTDAGSSKASTGGIPGKSATGKAPSDDASDASATTSTTAAATPSLDLFSMFGITVQQNAATQARTSGASTVAGVTGTAGSAPAEQDETEAEPEVTLASDIASFSHLAPATVLPGTQLAAPSSTAGKSVAAGKVDPAKRTAPTEAVSSTIQADTADTQVDKVADPASTVLASSSSKSAAAIDLEADAVHAPTSTTGSMQASIQAIVGAVSQLASTQVDAPATTATTAAAPTTVPSEKNVSLAPARTMTLQLMPAELGSVSVRLHMTGDTLDVSLGVSSQQTLGLLTREQGSLSSALTSQSYQLNSLVIQGTDSAAGSSGGSNASQGDSGGQARSNQHSSDSGARDPNGGARQQNGARQDLAARSSANTGDTQLYV